MTDNFWRWQHRALGWLMGWGAGSVIAGSGLLGGSPAARQAGLQAISWGAIDLILAVAGRRGALRKLHGPEAGDARAQGADAARFQKIVAINAGLDVLYILGGANLARSARDGARRGMGLGIIVQGLFLLIYDLVLTWAVGRRRAGLPGAS